MVWTNTSGGVWHASTNWSPNQIPTASDEVVITNAAAYTVTVEANAAATVVLGGSGAGPILRHTGGKLTLGSNSRIGAGGVWTMTGGTLAGELTVGTNALLAFTGAQTKSLEAAVTNRGTVQHQDSGSLQIYGNAGGRVQNEGFWELLGDADVYGLNGKPLFRNSGVFRKSAGAGTAGLGVSGTYPISLENLGSIESLSGVLQINGGGFLTGEFLTATGTRIELASGTWTQASLFSPTVSGSGSTRFTGTVLQLIGLIPDLAMTGGTVQLLPEFQGGVITNLVLAGSTLSGTNRVTGTLTCYSVTGPLTVAAGGEVTFLEGTLTGPVVVEPNGLLRISGNGTKYLNGVVTNQGTVISTAGLQMRGNSGARFENVGTWELQGNVDAMGLNGPPVISNTGIIRKTAGTGRAEMGPYWAPIHLQNRGLVESQIGTLGLLGSFDLTNGVVRAGTNAVVSLSGNGYLTGGFETRTGGRIEFVGGTWTQVAGEPTISGEGVLRLTGGTLQSLEVLPSFQFTGGTLELLPQFQGGVITNLVLAGSTLSGSNLVTGTLTCYSVTGPLTVAAGGEVTFLEGTLTGPVVVEPNGLLRISGNGAKYLNGALTNQGTVISTAGLQMRGNSGARFENVGIWELQGNVDAMGLNGPPVISNTGIIRKTAGTGRSEMGPYWAPIHLQNRGLVESQIGTLGLLGSFDLTNGVVRAGTNAVVSLSGNGYLTGGFETRTGGRIEFVGGTWTQVAGEPTISGEGVLRLTGGTLQSLEVLPSFQFTGGTLQLLPQFQGGVITNLVLAGSTLSGSNLVTGTLTCYSVTGPLTVAAGGEVTFLEGTLTGPVVVEPNGLLRISGNGTKYLNGLLTNQGTVISTAGLQMRGNSGARFENAGVWELQGNVDAMGLNGPPVIANTGIIRKTAGTGRSEMGPYWAPIHLENRGLVESQIGTLGLLGSFDLTNGVVRAGTNAVVSLSGNGYLTGGFDTRTGGRIEFVGGTWTQVVGEPAISGEGVLRLTGGTLQSLEVLPSFQFTGGTLQLLPQFQGGVITNLVLAGSTLSGSNLVTGTLTCYSVTGPLTVAAGGEVTFLEGTLSGPVVVELNGLLRISGNGTKYLNGALTNEGTVISTGGLQMRGNSGARFENAGVWELQGDVSTMGLNGPPVIHNTGVVRKTAGTGRAEMGPYWAPIHLQNRGLVESQIGTLGLLGSFDLTNGVVRAGTNAVVSLSGNGYLTGGFETRTGGRIEFDGGTWTQVAGEPAISGEGVLRLTGGTLQSLEVLPSFQFTGGTLELLPQFQGGVISNLVLSGTTLSGSNLVTGTLTCYSVTGPLTVAAGGEVTFVEGTLTGPVVVEPNGLLRISGNGTKYLNGALTNQGTVISTGGLQMRGNSGARFANAGVWELQGDVSALGLNGPPVIHNTGILRKTAGTGRADVGAYWAPIHLENLGLVESQIGTVALFGSYNLTNGTLRSAIRSASNYGRFSFGNEASLAGNLSAYIVDAYIPSLGAKFTLVTFPSATGTFSHLGLPAGLTWWPQYSAGDFAISVLNVCTPAPNGLAAWWPAEGTVTDIVSGTSGQLINGAAFETGLNGQAFAFDGVNDSVALGMPFTAQSFSLACWVKPAGEQSAQATLVDNNSTASQGWTVQSAGPGLDFQFVAAGIGTVPFTLSSNAWQLLVVTVDPSYTARVYLNGQLSNSIAGAGPIVYSGTPNLTLASWGGGGRHFQGLVDEVLLVNRVLESNEIAAIYLAGSAGLCRPTDPPFIVAQPVSRTNAPGQTASFTVSAAGSLPLFYQWLHAGVTLTNDARIAGAQANTLVISNLTLADAGEYFVTVSNAAGTAESLPATLFMDATPPVITQVTVVPGLTQATVTWRTDEPSSAAVDYGLTDTLGSTRTYTGVPRTNHSIVLTGLAPGETYHYRVRSADAVGNQAVSAVATFTQQAAPDLTVGGVAAPVSGQIGYSVSVIFSITNLGAAVAQGPWYNALVAANDAAGNGSFVLSGAYFNPGPDGLAPGASITTTQAVILPATSVGTRYLGTRVDYLAQLVEMNENNNTAYAPAPTTVVAPDLRVARVGAASTAEFGASLPVEFVITNAGNAPLTIAWNDRVFLSSANNSLSGATLLGTVAFTGVLAPGAAHTNTVTVTLPLSTQTSPGSYYLVVATDHGNAVVESQENNNLNSVPIALTLPPLPDLAITQVSAPTQAFPGESIPISWVVTNQGSLNITGKWSETVFLATNSAGLGNQQELTTFAFTNSLAAGAFLARTQTVTIPPAGIAGDLWLAVRADTRSDVIESNETNNLGVASALIQVPAVLTLQASATQISEGHLQPLILTVTRNGSRSAPLTVTLENTDPTELTVPEQVVILAGQASVSFNATALSDDLVDGPAPVTLTASAPGFEAATISVTVLDMNIPELSLTLVTNRLTEGLSVVATVSRTGGTANPVNVTIGSSSPTQLLPPANVAFAAGQTAVQVSLLALNDTLVEAPILVTISVSATGHAGATEELLIDDDDWPAVDLSVAPATVSENAGSQAAMLTITRNNTDPRALEVELESSHPVALLVPALVVIPAGQASVTVPLAAVDNTLVDGPKPVTVQGWFRATGTKQRLAQTGSAAITVTDNDGPTLQLAFNRHLVAEGQNPAATGTVTRNTASGEPLLVTLISSNTDELTLPPSVTIPAGAASATFEVASVEDGTTDGSQVVTVTAASAGYTAGSAQLTVTDINLPDLVATGIGGPMMAETEAYVDISYQVRNQGLAAASSNAITQRIYLSNDPVVGDDVLIGQYTFNGGLPSGMQFGQTFSARMPQTAGNYWIIVETDVVDSVVEIVENNNLGVSANPITVAAAYEAEVSTTVETAPASTPIPLAGRAFRAGGQPVPYALVNIHIRVRDTVRTISALTDPNGNFATTWQPLAGEAGLYSLAAGHPGVPYPDTQDTFRLLGMRAQPAAPSVRLAEQSSISGIVQIQNLGDVALTDLTAEMLSKPDTLEVTLTLQTNRLEGSASIGLAYGISALDASIIQGTIATRVTSAEGVVLDIPIRVSVDALVPRLVAQPQRLQGGMKRGVQRLVDFEVVNTGGAPTGPVAISLPPLPWMSLVTESPLPSMAPGETNRITLQLAPGEDLDLIVYSGNLALNATGTGLSVPFAFRALSDATGSLKVSAVDEFTYYAEGAPPVTNATVRVRDTLNGAVVTNGVTGDNGVLLISELAEGYYDLEVGADQHASFRGTVLVEPGTTNDITAFLSYQTVRYTWTVERIEIEDRYRITVETVFEANVPAPVVTVEPAVLDVSDLMVVGQTKQVNMTIRNHGLIAVDDVKLAFGDHPFYLIEPLIEDMGRLAAKSTLTIPVTMRRIGTLGGASGIVTAAGSGVPCGMSGNLGFHFQCGPVSVGGGTTIPVSGVQGDCGGGFAIPTTTTGTGPGTVYRPVYGEGTYGPIGVSSGQSSVSVGFKIGCDPLCLVLAGLGCIPGPIGCFAGGFACGYGTGDGVNGLDAADCAVAGAACLIPGAGLPGCIYSLMRCFITPTVGASGLVYLAGDGDDVLDYYKPGIRAQLDTFNLITGSPDGVWINPQADSATGDWFAAFQSATGSGSDGGRTITATERSALLAREQPPGVSTAEVTRVLERWNRTLENIALGILRPADAPQGANTDFIDIIELKSQLLIAATYQQAAEAAGFTDPINAIVETVRYREQTGEAGGVCARVKIRLDQEAVLSREAFRATLEIDNGGTSPLEHIRVDVRVTDRNGAEATSLFGLRPPELVGLSDVAGGGAVPGGAIGTARWTIIPSVDAAPLEPTQFFVSGEFRYTLNDVVVTVPLAPVPITVHPTARLTVDYFHERDVFSDDPHTEIVEPSIPFNLAIMVRNNGAGEARQFRITSAQPEIVENEKGLLIDFKIIGTEVAGQNLTPSLTANLGNIAPGGQAIGRWLLTSTLQGLFIDYDASFEHLDGLGNPKLSLIDEVRIHEMIRLVQAGGPFEDGKPDFLVNDKPDLRDLPDTLWLSNGTTNPVEVVTNAVINGTLSSGNLRVELAASMPGGWTYLRIPDPGNGQFRLSKITRSDSVQIGVNTNAWVTDRTFIGQGKRPVREDILHLLDHNSTGIYTLDYTPIVASDTEAPSSAITALPAQSQSVFLLNWSGQDNAGGTGIAGYEVFVSENGGPFQRWLNATPSTSSVFQGNLGSTYAFYSVAVDLAGNREPAPTAADTQTTVTMANQAPVFAAIPDQVIVEGETLRFTVAAVDPEGDSVSYSLAAGAPPGLVLNSQNGELTWLTSEAHGPSTNLISITARDTGFPQQSASRTFNIIVQEHNLAPTLADIPSYTVRERSSLIVTNSASDPDVPKQQLTFSLVGAPAGAAINATNGVFTWQPNNTQGGTTNFISVVVTDDGVPPLSATQTLAVVVLDTMPDFTLSIGSTAVLSNASGSLPLMLASGVDLTDLRLDLAVSSDRLTNWSLSGLAPEVGFANLVALGSNQFSLQFESRAATVFRGSFTLAQLGFLAVSNEHSEVVRLRSTALDGHRPGHPDAIQGVAGVGQVFVVGLEPILDARWLASNQLGLTLYARPGGRYVLERSAGVDDPSAWNFHSLLEPTDLRTDLPPRAMGTSPEFFRALIAESGIALPLTIWLEGSQVIVEWPADCPDCVLEGTSSLPSTAGTEWVPETAVPQPINGRMRVQFPASSGPKFLRLVIQTP